MVAVHGAKSRHSEATEQTMTRDPLGEDLPIYPFNLLMDSGVGFQFGAINE